MNQSNSAQQIVVNISDTAPSTLPSTESLVTSNALQTSSSDTVNARSLIVQNGNVYQLPGNSQVLNKTTSEGNSGISSITKNVILNTIQQGGNLSQRIKMTAVKPNVTSFNVNLNTSKSMKNLPFYLVLYADN